MKCEEFLEVYTAATDGTAPPEVQEAFRRHRSQCPPCERYARILDDRGRWLSALAPVEPSTGFHASLNRRLDRVESEFFAFRQGASVSGAHLAAALALGLLLVAVAWSGAWTSGPARVKLDPVLAAPPRTGPGLPGVQPVQGTPWTPGNQDRWPPLYEYSTLRMLHTGPHSHAEIPD